MEKIEKRLTQKEVIEFMAKCKDCGKRIIGSTEGQVAYNLIIHKKSKSCVGKKNE